MKKKIDLFWYWFIFVVAFVLCFFAINDKKINAYYFNDNGNLVSDNLIDLCIYDDYSNNGINTTINDDCTLSITGTATNVWASLSTRMSLELEAGDYSFAISSAQEITFTIRIYYANDSDVFYIMPGRTLVNITLPDDGVAHILGVDYMTRGQSYDVQNVGISISKGHDKVYEPYGVWYSESNLNTEKEVSYENGYNAGIVANNSAPNFYFDDITSLMQFRVLGNTSYIYVDHMSYVTGYNSIINFSELLGVQYGTAYFAQYYWTTLSLLNTINVGDTLVFNFSDIQNAPGFSTKTAITFSSSSSCYDIGNGGTMCPNYASFTYDELLQNNFTLKLEDFGELEDVTEIDTISVQFYYNGTRSFGLLTLEDETLTGDITTDYEIGYRVGFITGEESGVIKGETIGYDKGYNEGYRKASQVVRDPGNNTLVGMVSVLMGMPVNMLISIYDFEFLGINLAEFFFSLITLLVSIWLIKKLL